MKAGKDMHCPVGHPDSHSQIVASHIGSAAER
jgi:hypothetical protein